MSSITNCSDCNHSCHCKSDPKVYPTDRSCKEVWKSAGKTKEYIEENEIHRVLGHDHQGREIVMVLCRGPRLIDYDEAKTQSKTEPQKSHKTFKITTENGETFTCDVPIERVTEKKITKVASYVIDECICKTCHCENFKEREARWKAQEPTRVANILKASARESLITSTKSCVVCHHAHGRPDDDVVDGWMKQKGFKRIQNNCNAVHYDSIQRTFSYCPCKEMPIPDYTLLQKTMFLLTCSLKEKNEQLAEKRAFQASMFVPSYNT